MRDRTHEKRPSKTAIKPHSARSLLSLLIRDVLSWYTVLGDDLFSLNKHFMMHLSLRGVRLVGAGTGPICVYIGVPVRTFPVI